MKLATIQASAIKSTFEVLKDILNDVNVYFKPDGMYITTLDTARTSLVDMYLSSDNFEEYECEDEIVAGINVTNTFKLLKSITNNDVLMIYMNSREFMEIEIHNENKKTCTKFALKLLDINENQIEVPEMNMTTITPMASVDFQRICRDMYNIGSDIEITRDGNLFRLKCEGDFASQETEIQCTTESPHISGIYSLRYMNIFTKATSMCSTVQIMQEDQNRFLILKYNVANLGDLKFYLATKTRTDQ
ncbi:MAG: proliferating cell nuclear antigen (pcna) [Acidimicrobiaceae bacterium]|nr:proliferating cell nuclear antigen (pcna) [Acidimicrobiaceae bacterium]|tara:strand:- start:272 stop:1012 length:741 start_codon:yes stop_codon:yes gene_type:complete